MLFRKSKHYFSTVIRVTNLFDIDIHNILLNNQDNISKRIKYAIMDNVSRYIRKIPQIKGTSVHVNFIRYPTAHTQVMEIEILYQSCKIIPDSKMCIAYKDSHIPTLVASILIPYKKQLKKSTSTSEITHVSTQEIYLTNSKQKIHII